MSILTTRLDENTKVEFGVSITGASGIPKARLVIEGKNFNIDFPAKIVNGMAHVEIKELKGILESGEYPVSLEVILENKIYTPLRDTIIFDPSIEVGSKSAQVVKESIVIESVTVTTEISEDKKNSIAMMVANTLGYQVSGTEIIPQNIIENALRSANIISLDRLQILGKMLTLAEEAKIEFDQNLITTLKVKQ